MLVKAYAKVNISLDVVGKREDGYHLLKMIMQNIDLFDEISINSIDSGIKLGCNKAYIPLDNRNLAYKAAELFINEYNVKKGVEIYIKKNIPVCAGLAGGSTDAAAVLRGLRDIYKPEISDKDLMALALKIGADVPYCIFGETALCEGIGEIITKLSPFRNKIMVLVKPQFGVSTKEVYSKLDINKIVKHPRTMEIIKAMEENDLKFIGNNLKNVLENVTVRKYRIISEIKKQMLDTGALGALMSGSGPTVFALFDNMFYAQNCYDLMKKKFKEVYITRTV